MLHGDVIFNRASGSSPVCPVLARPISVGSIGSNFNEKINLAS